MLTRSREDRRRYDLEGWGSVRKPGFLGSTHELTTWDGTLFQTDVSGFFSYRVRVYDEERRQVGEYEPGAFFNAELSWRDQVFQLRPERRFSRQLVLSRLGKDWLRIRGSRFDRETPVRVAVEDPEIEAGLVLFTTRILLSARSDAPAGGG